MLHYIIDLCSLIYKKIVVTWHELMRKTYMNNANKDALEWLTSILMKFIHQKKQQQQRRQQQ